MVFGFAKKDKAASKESWISRFKIGLKKTHTQLTQGLTNLVLGEKTIDQEVLDNLETLLLSADVGTAVTEEILHHITQLVERKALNDIETLRSVLKQELTNILKPVSQPLEINTSPFVLLVVGVNGSGKTTSIAKLAHYYKQQGKKVLMAAGDTFRAAACEQLKTWGERHQVPVIAQGQGADAAAVIYDAMQATLSRQFDVLIADTAGRLHTQTNLMQELAKIKKVLSKLQVNAPQEVMLILDATTGQNAINQAKLFHQSIGLTSISITKLDGTAKAGVVFAIAKELQLPIRFVGLGEKIDDLRVFDPEVFVNALLD